MATDTIQNLRIDPADLPEEAVIFGCTAAMRDIRSKIGCILSGDLPVLIQGESGTGKEIVARFLHTRSDRRDKLFVRLNCAVIPASLVESELFGYERGSFTGALEARAGLVEIADGGTLFLDEIGDMGWELQGKLLRLLQDGTYTRIGGGLERRARVRVVCATNLELQQAVQSGAFREDLFDRINTVSLRMPALRDRKSDIPQLCQHFLEKLSRQFRRTAPRLNSATLHLLKQWNWPGNLRELENWIARAIILGDDEGLGAELRRQVEMAGGSSGWQPRSGSLKDVSRRAASEATNALILKALQANRWNCRRTAEELNMSYRSLLYRMHEVGLPQRRRTHRGPQLAN
jgi:two-component system response regulator AtoC